jgi:hypothetical protein
MKRSLFSSWPALTGLRKHGFLVSAMAFSLTGWLIAQDPAKDVPSPPTPVTDPAVPNAVPEVLGTGPGDVLTRGPIHEAFAKPVVDGNAESPVVPKLPPAAIEELPPDERPVGENVLWIPGYFAWDEDRLDFIWISGVYRDAPPGHTWIAGYWRTVPNGAQWVPGFWTTIEAANANQQAQTEVEYLPQPPASLEQGPTTEQPGESHFWIPGNWRYVNNKYAWQAGYWSAGQPGWIWVPAHYNWTPLGFVYTSGFWDYSLSLRGLAFAPVYFDAAYYANPVVYRPAVVLRPNFLTVHLWSRPQFAHYYFGDYYGNTYTTAGYRPWFTPLVANRAYYDPLFTYYSWQGRRVDPHWNRHIQQRYDFVVNHADARPPRTYRDQYRLAQQPQNVQYVNNATIVNNSNTIIDLGNNPRDNRRGPRQNFGTDEDVTSLQIQNAAMTANLAQVSQQQKQLPKAALQLEKVNPDTLDRFAKQGRQFREIAAQRQQMAGPGLPGLTTEAVAPSTSGSPTTKTVPLDNRSKLGGGKVRLPAVQPVAGVAANGQTPRAAVGGNGVGDALIPVVTPEQKQKMATKGRNPAGGTAASKSSAAGTSASGQPATGTTAADDSIATDRNPNQLGKNVPPNPQPGLGDTVVGSGLVGGAAVPGGVDTAIVPLDIVTPGTGPVVNNQGNPVSQNSNQTNSTGPNTNGTNATGTTNNNPNNGTASGTSTTPNTTANTVPGQRTPAGGAFGQDQGALVPPGQLAPGQQNPEVFNPRVADPNAAAGSGKEPAFNPKVGDPNVSTNNNTDPNGAGNTNGANPGTTGTTPNTTANSVPGQRTPAGGAFGQDQGALVPPGQLAPGQQNPEVFNPRVADPNAAAGSGKEPAFNPKVGDPNVSTNNNTDPNGAGNTNGANPGTTGTTPNTTANTVPGQRTPAGGAFGQDQGALAPPGKLAPGQQNPEVFNPRAADPNAAPGSKNAPSFNPRVGDPSKSTNSADAQNSGSNNNAAGNNTPGNNTSNTNSKSATNNVPGQRTPAGGAFGQDQGALTPPGKLAPGQQNSDVFNPKSADPNASPGSKNAPAFNPKVADPTKAKNNPDANKAGSTAAGSNTSGAGTNNNKSGAASTSPRAKGPASGANMINGRPAGGNPGNENPALRTGATNGPSVNPNAPLPNAGKNGNNPLNSNALGNPNRGGNPRTPGKGPNAPVGPGGGAGGLAPMGGASPGGGGGGAGAAAGAGGGGGGAGGGGGGGGAGGGGGGK